LLAAALGRLDAAVDHLEAAVAGNDAMDARSWAAHSRHELAATLRSRGDVGDEDRADRLDAEAKATAERLGMMLAMEIAGTAADGAATGQPARSVSTVMAASFRREGEYWTVRFGTDAFRLRDSKGLRHLARLLAEPGREIHVL